MSVDANHLATKGDLDALLHRLEQRLAAVTTPAAPAALEEYLTLDEVATATRVSTKTVKKWVHEGKYDRKGKLIRLLALEFSPGYLRIPRSALLAYGEGLGFTVQDLRQPPPAMRVAS